jgi:hypothetical protein
LREVPDHRVYGGIEDTIKVGFQAKQVDSKKATIWMLAFVAISMAVEPVALGITKII